MNENIRIHLQNIKPFLYPSLATVATLCFVYVAIPVANEYKSKNSCISIATKQLKDQLPNSYINDSGINKNELAKMISYQLCTHRNDNR